MTKSRRLERLDDRVSVKASERLRSEIERAFGSVAAFLRDCDPEHGDLRDVTYRALRREPVRFGTLKRIARAAGVQEASRLVDEIAPSRRRRAPTETVRAKVVGDLGGVDVNGDWIGGDVDFCPQNGLYVEVERASLAQHGTDVSGSTLLALPGGGHLEVAVRDAVLAGRVLTARLAVQDWPDPDGLAVVCMLLKSNDRVLDGHITWFDPDESAVRCSRIIWVREDAHNRNELLAWAKRALVEEFRMSLMRRFTAGEIGFSDAARMVERHEIPEFDFD